MFAMRNSKPTQWVAAVVVGKTSLMAVAVGPAGKKTSVSVPSPASDTIALWIVREKTGADALMVAKKNSTMFERAYFFFRAWIVKVGGDSAAIDHL
uniref:Uncharacterized protein n=1 Tax=Plectus sambesii TaxID=2011161 RepID=A0A914VAH0_9BILA